MTASEIQARTVKRYAVVGIGVPQLILMAEFMRNELGILVAEGKELTEDEVFIGYYGVYIKCCKKFGLTDKQMFVLIYDTAEATAQLSC